MLTTETLEKPGIAHGFMTRHGGVSQGLYASLNCGNGSKDNPSHVAENRSRALDRLFEGHPAGETSRALVTLHQVHSARAVILDGPIEGSERPQADGLVTRRKGLAIGVLTADCGPVLFADAEAGVVGAAHAGWRGALYGVLEATIDAMIEAGAQRERIAACVGPCIGRRSYQVGPEFPLPFLERDADARVFFSRPDGEGRCHFDLRAYIAWRLGLAEICEVEALANDTCAEEADFFSYRRACHRGETDYGRGISLIAVV